LGRSRGGFGSKLHVSVDARGVPVELKLTAGQESDATHAGSLLGNHRPKAVIADKAYDSDRIRSQIAGLGAKAVIPPLKCRRAPLKYDKKLYKERNLAERFWSVAKQCRRVATRYDKTDTNYLGFVHVATIRYLLSLHDQERLSYVHTA
jgi:transposase